MDKLLLEEYIYVAIWASIGAIIGFFSFANLTKMSIYDRFAYCFRSISIGVILALTIFTYLIDMKELPIRVSLMLSGLGAFGLPDFIINHYPKLLKKCVYKVTKNDSE